MRAFITTTAALLALFGFSSIAESVECATSKCYIDVYKTVESESLPVVNRAIEIHQKLTRRIGSQQARRSRLFVIDTDGSPWAVALRDNTIVVTAGALRNMYSEGDLEIGDARAALVIGHELSHLSTDDLFHHRSFVYNQKHESNEPEWFGSRPEEELRADLRGYTFATIAGYRTDLLLQDESDFFRTWLEQVTTNVAGSTHPDNESRRRYIERGFNTILSDVPYYQFAVALAHFGSYKDAGHLLEDHLNLVETEEAYSNLGYIHVQRAREYMSEEDAYRYWVPTLLEPRSGVVHKSERDLFGSGLSQQTLYHLESAEQALLQSIAMDGENLASYINLAAVYLYMPDKVHRAYAAVEDAKRTRLGSLDSVSEQLESIYQLIRVNDDHDGGDRWSSARDKLVEMAETSSPVPDNLLFNLARMLDVRGRRDTAKNYWKQLHERLDVLPVAYQVQVCKRLRVDCSEREVKSPWTSNGLPLGQDIRYPEVRQLLAEKWDSDPTSAKELVSVVAQVFNNEVGDSLLSLDNHLAMAIIRNVPKKYKDVGDLVNVFGEALVYLPMADGQLLSYGTWAAVVRDRIVVELWLDDLE